MRTAEELPRELVRVIGEELHFVVGEADEREDEVLDERGDVRLEEGEHGFRVDAVKGA